MKRVIVSLAAVLISTAASAQSAAPMVGDRPLVQVRPRTVAAAKPQQSNSQSKPQSAAVRLQACLDIDDGTKERLNCYDEVIVPASKPKTVKAKTVADCKFSKEEDERLACFNGFVESMPKLPKT